jgi:hypothetical protein
MSEPNDTTGNSVASLCSSAFTYDEIIGLIRRKQKFWNAKASKAQTVEDIDTLHVYSMACEFIIQAIALEKHQRRSCKIIEAIDAEEEFDGDIPQDVFDTASTSPEAMAEALRVACRLTKQGIKRRVEALT